MQMKHFKSPVAVTATVVIVALSLACEDPSVDGPDEAVDTDRALDRLSEAFELVDQAKTVAVLVWVRQWLHNELLDPEQADDKREAGVGGLHWIAAWLDGIPEVVFAIDQRIIDGTRRRVRNPAPRFRIGTMGARVLLTGSGKTRRLPRGKDRQRGRVEPSTPTWLRAKQRPSELDRPPHALGDPLEPRKDKKQGVQQQDLARARHAALARSTKTIGLKATNGRGQRPLIDG